MSILGTTTRPCPTSPVRCSMTSTPTALTSRIGNDGTGGNADDESGIGAVTLTLSPTYDIVDGLVVDTMVTAIRLLTA